MQQKKLCHLVYFTEDCTSWISSVRYQSAGFLSTQGIRTHDLQIGRQALCPNHVAPSGTALVLHFGIEKYSIICEFASDSQAVAARQTV